MLRRLLTIEMINGANSLAEGLVTWKLSDDVICATTTRFPQFDRVSCVAKAVILNTLYGTNVLAIMQMALHIERTLAGKHLCSLDLEIVEEIATLQLMPSNKRRRYVSFASKFAHFYLDSERFPIYDQYAAASMVRHLGRGVYRLDNEHPYLAYCEAVRILREETGFEGSIKELDRYLWLAGEYHAWLRNDKVPINREMQSLFANPSSDAQSVLNSIKGL